MVTPIKNATYLPQESKELLDRALKEVPQPDLSLLDEDKLAETLNCAKEFEPELSLFYTVFSRFTSYPPRCKGSHHTLFNTVGQGKKQAVYFRSLLSSVLTIAGEDKRDSEKKVQSLTRERDERGALLTQKGEECDALMQENKELIGEDKSNKEKIEILEINKKQDAEIRQTLEQQCLELACDKKKQKEALQETRGILKEKNHSLRITTDENTKLKDNNSFLRANLSQTKIESFEEKSQKQRWKLFSLVTLAISVASAYYCYVTYNEGEI